EDGIRDGHVTGVQTCALPISRTAGVAGPSDARWIMQPPSPDDRPCQEFPEKGEATSKEPRSTQAPPETIVQDAGSATGPPATPEIGRASCRERAEMTEDSVS